MSQPSSFLSVRSYSAEADSHHHSYHQLVLPLSGELKMRVGNHHGNVCTHKGAVIAAGEEHRFAAVSPNNFVIADIPVALAPVLDSIPAFVEMDTALKHYVCFMSHQLHHAPLAAESEKQMTMMLVQLLHERFGATKRLDRRLLAAQAHLDVHYTRSISLNELATIANLSTRQLTTRFKEAFATTPQQYLITLRMNHAKQLLTDTNLSIQQVADQVGYSHLASFSDRFQKHFGHSPRHYRQLGK